MMEMEAVTAADELLQTALNNHERDLAAQIAGLDDMKRKLTSRIDELKQKKEQIAKEYGNIDAAHEDLIEINAGGRVIAAKRSTLTQLEGTRLAGLFSGRWDKKLQRDSHGRIFLDVNPICFQAIVDYLTEMLISSEDSPPEQPSVDNEHEYILQQQLKLFLQQDRADSNIIEDKATEDQFHSWLNEDDSDGKLKLLYRGSKDGFDAASFHANCDDKGPTLTIVETTDGYFMGGYSDLPWMNASYQWHYSNKAFIFVAGRDTPPQKMKILNDQASKMYAVCHNKDYGPTFGGGLLVQGTNVTLSICNANNAYYDSSNITGPLANAANTSKAFQIKEIEVFSVTGKPSVEVVDSNTTKERVDNGKDNPINIDDVNTAITTKRKALLRFESDVQYLEDRFEDEQSFINGFVCGDTKDIVVLNVNGTIMVTKRETLCTIEESVLAQQFDDTKWTEKGCNNLRVKEWTPNEVCDWAKKIDDISGEVAQIFVENEITGNELFALNMDGLKMIGVERAGTLCLLLEEIKKLKQSSQDTVTLIEHSPYCFGKILDYLRLKHMQCQGLIDAEMTVRPIICESQKKRFSKVVQYYFPGDSAKMILPDPPSPVGFSFGTAAAAPVAQSFYFGAPP